VHGFQFACGFGYESAHLPVTGVESEGDRCAVFGAQAAVRAEDENFRAEGRGQDPNPAADVLAEAEEIAGGLGRSISGGNGESAGWAGAWVATVLNAKSAVSRTDVRDIS
jgi:hypothetical protein